MGPIADISGILRNYMDRCVNCTSGRNGTCPWISRFQETGITPDPTATDHEGRAILLHETAGCPCEKQCTFDQIIDQVDEFTAHAILPASTEELLDTLSSLEQFLSRLRRLTKTFRPVFTDITLAAIEHALAHIDYAFLKKKLDIEPLIRHIHPDYDRTRTFLSCGFPKYLVTRYLAKAEPYRLADADPDPVPDQAPDPISINGLPPELSTPKALAIWEKARKAGIVNDHYRFLGTKKNELAIFAGSFSMALFKEIRWEPFQTWHPYPYYIKTYSSYSQFPPRKETETMKKIKALFNE